MYQRFIIQALKNCGAAAISNEDHLVTYGGLLEMSEALRPLLAGQADRCSEDRSIVLIALPGGPHFTAVQLACFAEHAVAAPIPFRSTRREIQSYLELIQPDLVVVNSLDGSRELIQSLERPATVLAMNAAETDAGCPQRHRVLAWAEVAQRKGEHEAVSRQQNALPPDISLIQFTSGSTGRPKGVILSSRNIAAYLDHNQAFFRETEGEAVFCPMPQFHAYGWTVVLESLLNGSAVHVTNRFEPGTEIARMQKLGCSIISAAPSYLKLLIKFDLLVQGELPSLRMVCMGTAATDQKLVKELRDRFPALTIVLRYALTATMGPITRLKIMPGDDLLSPGLVGIPVPGVEVAPGLPPPGAGDPGEVRVRSGVIAAGQLLERGRWLPLLDADGFFATGDLGYADEAGQLHLRGRTSSFIKRNGFRINPFEIEELLHSLPGIHEAVAVGIPDPTAGEQIVVCIEPEPGTEIPGLQQLASVCRENLSPYKLPQRFVIMAKLPRKASGKADRMKLRSLAAQ